MYQRKWIGHPEDLKRQNEPTDWHEITETQLRRAFEGTFIDVDLAVDSLKYHDYRTLFAYYRIFETE